MTMASQTPVWHRLSAKIVGMLLGFMLLALLAIGATLLLSWQLQGSSAAINEAGSLRMHSYRLTSLLSRVVNEPQQRDGPEEAQQELRVIDATFERLRRGDPQRPLFLPPATEIRSGFAGVVEHWHNTLRPLASAVLTRQGEARRQAWQDYQPEVEDFVSEVDNLVRLIEHDSELRMFWLRSSQLGMVALALCGTITIIYLMYLMIIEPVNRLGEGMQRMAGKDFSVRLPVESRDEFGVLARGFNRMADRLEELYRSLEQRVEKKTAALADQNRELVLLYDSAAFLQRPQTVEQMCEGFLQRISDYFEADGGSVRVLDERRGNLHMVAQRGLSPSLTEAEHCLKVGDCLCGAAVEQKIAVVHDLHRMDQGGKLQCHREGFATVSVFHIHAHSQHIGFFNLHFRKPAAFTHREQALLETLGQLLGIAIENQRLGAREREMAVSEERNLVAQGLHDSIAQGLTFLNIQVQLLDDSLRAGNTEEASGIVPALRSGVQESYEDVRELLMNFRSRLAEDDFHGTLRATIDKFRHQTGIDVHMQADGVGAPFPREQQLQLLFIVQEALSNVRKHAMASRVDIRLEDGQDFMLMIHDDGVGFDADTLRRKGESHVGLNIMRERAQRIHASLTVDSGRGQGTTVLLQLPHEQRRAA